MVIVLILVILAVTIFIMVLTALSYTGNSAEKQLGYPKRGESMQDVQFLLSIGEHVLAQRCYRRIHRCWEIRHQLTAAESSREIY